MDFSFVSEFFALGSDLLLLNRRIRAARRPVQEGQSNRIVSPRDWDCSAAVNSAWLHIASSGVAQ
jgi:hypothetical protein